LSYPSSVGEQELPAHLRGEIADIAAAQCDRAAIAGDCRQVCDLVRPDHRIRSTNTGYSDGGGEQGRVQEVAAFHQVASLLLVVSTPADYLMPAGARLFGVGQRSHRRSRTLPRKCWSDHAPARVSRRITMSSDVLLPLSVATPSSKQRVFIRYYTGFLMDLVVLNLFAEYWGLVSVDTFTTFTVGRLAVAGSA
jgi:hypothetical protein